MTEDRLTTVAFTGHRTYGGQAAAALRATVGELYARGFRTFLCGMAMGFDLAAAEEVLACRDSQTAIPFRGQESRFPAVDRERFRRVLAAADHSVTLSPSYHAGCYAVRNNYLVEHAALLVAWYDGSPGGTHYTVRRALGRGLEFINLHPHPAALRQAEPTLF